MKIGVERVANGGLWTLGVIFEEGRYRLRYWNERLGAWEGPCEAGMVSPDRKELLRKLASRDWVEIEDPDLREAMAVEKLAQELRKELIRKDDEARREAYNHRLKRLDEVVDAGKSTRFKRLPVTLRAGDRKTAIGEVSADVFGGLAVHRSINRPGTYDVTHVGSGAVVLRGIRSKVLARGALVELSRAADFKVLKFKPTRELFEGVVKPLEELCR